MALETVPRYIDRFTDRDGLNAITFPTLEYECEDRDDVIAPVARAVGLDYGFDPLGQGTAPLGPGSAKVRGIIDAATPELLDVATDAMKANAYLNASGKLWTLGADGTRRWCWARVVDLPQMTIARNRTLWTPAITGFRKDSHWFAEATTTLTRTITASGQTWAWTNPGLLPAKQITLRFRANTAAGIVNPKLVNSSNLYTFESARDSASVNSEIKLVTGQIPQYSNDNGSTYTDDFANYVIPTLQEAFSFVLNAGVNNMVYTGGASQSLDIEAEFYAVYP